MRLTYLNGYELRNMSETLPLLASESSCVAIFATDLDALLLPDCIEDSLIPLRHVGVPRSAWHTDAAYVCGYTAASCIKIKLR